MRNLEVSASCGRMSLCQGVCRQDALWRVAVPVHPRIFTERKSSKLLLHKQVCVLMIVCVLRIVLF